MTNHQLVDADMWTWETPIADDDRAGVQIDAGLRTWEILLVNYTQL